MTAPFSTADIVRRWAAEAPDSPAIVMDERVVTWRALYEGSVRVATGLLSEGLAKGDRIAFLGKGNVEFFEILFGAALAGVVLAPLNWRLSAAELAAVVADLDPGCVFIDAEYASLASRIAAQTSAPAVLIGDACGEGAPYARWTERRDAMDPDAALARDDVVMQFYTSGTTGVPKGVMLTNANLASLVEGGGDYGMGPGSVNLVAMPLFHLGGAGWALTGMCSGAVTVVQREFNSAAVLEAIGRYEVTHALLVPAMLLALTQAPEIAQARLSSLEAVMYGASPISEALLERCLGLLGCRFYQTYGLTETAGPVTMLLPEDHLDLCHRERLRSAGRVKRGVEIKIADPATGDAVPDGQVGEILVKSSQVMKGYWRRPAETAASVDANGWFCTGDAGYFREGYLYLHDRIKDMIVTGGENVYPAEVENVLMRHPAVGDVAVIAVPSERWGEEVKALVLRKEDAAVTALELTAYARSQLAGYKTPKSIDFVSALPRNPSGKLLKKDLREPYWRGRQRAVN